MLLAAFAVSRGCVSRGSEVSKEDAIAIASREIDYRAERTQVRFVRRGIPSRGYWAVSLATVDESGRLGRVTVVLVDAKTRRIAEVREGGP